MRIFTPFPCNELCHTFIIMMDINLDDDSFSFLKVPLNAVVELVFVDEGFSYDANHPIHLHGYSFRVVAMERMGHNVTVDEVKSRDQKGLIKRNLLNPPSKDTVTVPDGGYTIVRFQAYNPGECNFLITLHRNYLHVLTAHESFSLFGV